MIDPPSAFPDKTPAIPALLKLLTDDSKSTQRAVIKAFEDLGDAGEVALEGASRAVDPLERGRARAALTEVRRRRGHTALAGHLAGGKDPNQPCLIPGLLAIDDILGFRERSGAADLCPAELALEDWAGELEGERAWREGPTLAAAGALRNVLSDRGGLKGPTSDFHNLQHVSLSRTIVQRTGLPLTLCAIYAAVARRNGLQAALLPFPGQVLLGLGPAQDRLILDPFNGGVLVSLADCLRRLTEMGAPPSPEWLAPASDRSMLVRQTRNLGAAMARHGRERDARAFAQLAEKSS